MSHDDDQDDFLRTRYARLPHMRVYDTHAQVLRPYVTFAAQPGLRSPVLNTDGQGFRVSCSPRGMVGSEGWREQGGGLVLGGSFVFGMGATHDGATIPSVLATRSSSAQLNLGICAGNSLQELVSAIPYLDRADSVVVCSGINNLMAGLRSLGHNERFGPLFYEGAIRRLFNSEQAKLTPALPEAVETHRVRPAASVGAARRTRPELTPQQLTARMEAALARQLRDLSVLAAMRDRFRLLFCVQPFADPELRDLTEDERAVFAMHDDRRDTGRARDAWDFVRSVWPSYARRLADGCAELRVPVLRLDADRFQGWSFIDRVHMTDHGYRQVADAIWEALC